ncbi:reversion-inducing cysteine-rich protein with Kazal motifs [Neocloeon triangulifer]|uniref:reversion-inducing cysteine-rich protein with Kazal motifs n=1 Tax=Neocloeon triangulifer TaxID=2078957 RepID=UPI00286F1B1E|nr:reversion-inducing cysteine-rich protein with Kazal motifs [Neocloeon triangulifer]
MWSLWIFLLLFSTTSAQESACCARATGSCRSACEKMSLVSVAADPAELHLRVDEVQKFCPDQMVPFWECMNETIRDIKRGGSWSGRLCCPLALSARCQTSCVKASSRSDLTLNCRQSDEIDFFSCLSRQEVGDECCAPAHSPECRSACSAVFRTERTPSRAALEAVLETCGERSPRVRQCVRNHTKLMPAHNTEKYLHCCERSQNLQCSETCRRALRTKTTQHEIVDALQDGGCGAPMQFDSDKVWTCLMQSGNSASGRPSSGNSGEASRIDRTGIDSAKLHCCSKARSPACRLHCVKTFQNEWSRNDVFDRDCLSQPHEEKLVRCITDVEEPCELGCDGLNYCTNLNHRPTQLFRSCNAQADEAARFDVTLWQQQGFIQMPGGFSLPVRNTSHCNPDAWKAVACALQTRPCHPQEHTSNICFHDCVELLSECVDQERLPAGASVATMCGRLSPEGASCISLRNFLQPSAEWAVAALDLQVTAPCRGDPCNESEVCVVNRNCPAGKACPQYSCIKGCRLGDVSQYVVPRGSYMRFPVSRGSKSCIKICQCSAKGTAESCVQLPCYSLDACMLGSFKIEHGDTFFMDCNLCSCYAGEITCSKRHCEPLSTPHQPYSSLPCNCPAHHMPVCGRNGNTYPSACLAKCAGLKDSDFDMGPCSSRDPCDPNPCSVGRCVPLRQVCLSHFHKTCPQFECVDTSRPCSEATFDPVCDADNQEHPNLCYLVQYNKRLAYKGKCLANCKWVGVVCGADGQSHLSECAALASRVAVDYEGPCLAVGLALPAAAPQCGATVQCRPLAAAGCAAATPPGACCPACGGALRVLFSQKQADRAVLAVRRPSAVSVAAVLAALERHVQTAECRLLGHLTVEADLFVQVRPVFSHPSALQLAACVAEAHKLAALVQQDSPRLLSELSLSVLTAAEVAHGPAAVAASASTLALGVWPLAAIVAARLVL